MIATVLVSTTSSTIQTYENHATNVWGIYTTNNDLIGNLRASECQSNTFRLNDESVESSGYRSSNCITKYNANVKREVEVVSDKLNDINLKFGEVALNVYRSYIGVNPMVDGLEIERHINATFVTINQDWLDVKPDTATLRTNLTNNINALATTLQTCFTGSFNYMNSLASNIREQIDYCSEYGGARFNNAYYEQLLKAFEEMKNSYSE